MQNIQKNPMLSVREAASALGIDERTVREKLSSQQWKGEKRLVGMKEKWFMYRGELERQLDRLKISKPQERVSTQGMDTVFETDQFEPQTIDAQMVDVGQNIGVTAAANIAIDDLLLKLAQQFSKQLHAEKEVIFTLQRELADKDRQLRLLPDIQKRAEEDRKSAELKALESEALRKQIAALAEEKSRAEQILKAETERLEAEKETEVTSVRAEIARITEELSRLKQPWWKKMFGAGENAT
jgi:hypothetical protein